MKGEKLLVQSFFFLKTLNVKGPRGSNGPTTNIQNGNVEDRATMHQARYMDELRPTGAMYLHEYACACACVVEYLHGNNHV